MYIVLRNRRRELMKPEKSQSAVQLHRDYSRLTSRRSRRNDREHVLMPFWSDMVYVPLST